MPQLEPEPARIASTSPADLEDGAIEIRPQAVS
jgi:hypothetical protein